MPRDNSLRTILVLGSGPIVIGQACEFDYSGTQAVKALSQEGYRVVLVNSNPATIMTDPDLLVESARHESNAVAAGRSTQSGRVGLDECRAHAHATYIEPLTLESLRRIVEVERPDAVLPTVGGQTAINLALEMADAGLLEQYGMRMLGANPEALRLAEDRLRFKEAMVEIGLDVPKSVLVSTRSEALEAAEIFGFPLVVRASFTLGGMGSGAARDREEFLRVVERGLELSPVHQVLIEESVHGWHEYELEVMRDGSDQAVVICSIENFDPMGVHTGDSITVAPAMTLTDREYQEMRDQAFRVIRRIGVETGGSNIQFALHPTTRRITVIEMNPRVSRSSALASKATGFPIAKIAARLAVGYRLDEIANDITQKTPACFEPALDYVVVKIPRWNFEKFPGAATELGTQMRSVGEVMAIGRTFQEALQKGMRSLELSTSRSALEVQSRLAGLSEDALQAKLRVPDPERMYSIREALGRGYSVVQIHDLSAIDPWFLQEIEEVVQTEKSLEADVRRESEVAAVGRTLRDLPAQEWRRLKRMGFSDARLAKVLGVSPLAVRQRRLELGVRPVFHRVDTCAGEFQSFTPYLYSTYESHCEAEPTDRRKVLVLGGGPIRIGQGIEFDYCACHAAFALNEMGLESILLNCNPETVSTDYDTADRLYFEPVTFEDVMNVVEREWPEGIIVQFGGQTPLNLARELERAGVRILGTSVGSIDLAEDRYRFADLLESLGIPRPEMGTAMTVEEACSQAARIGYPIMVRPSYVLGGRAMQVVYDEEALRSYARTALDLSAGNPLFLDRFLEDAFELDVDAVADGEDVFVAGIQQHIEEAGIHSGDSACVLPPYKVSRADQHILAEYTVRLARALEVVGLLNVQFAIKDGKIYVIEANPRASRTIPYVSKAIGMPLARIATRVILGGRLEDLLPRDALAPREDRRSSSVQASTPSSLPLLAYERFLPNRIIVKMPVFSSNRFPEVDTLLGPEMRSTGEVLGIGRTFGEAFLKAALGAGLEIPYQGNAFVSVHDNDKEEVFPIARDLSRLGFHLLATQGTARFLQARGLEVETVFKVNEGSPHIAELIADRQVDLVVNTPLGRESHYDEAAIRRSALAFGVPCVTTLSGSRAVVDAIRTLREGSWIVESIQSLSGGGRPSSEASGTTRLSL